MNLKEKIETHIEKLENKTDHTNGNIEAHAQYMQALSTAYLALATLGNKPTVTQAPAYNL
jgi:hypothetical protein